MLHTADVQDHSDLSGQDSVDARPEGHAAAHRQSGISVRLPRCATAWVSILRAHSRTTPNNPSSKECDPCDRAFLTLSERAAMACDRLLLMKRAACRTFPVPATVTMFQTLLGDTAVPSAPVGSRAPPTPAQTALELYQHGSGQLSEQTAPPPAHQTTASCGMRSTSRRSQRLAQRLTESVGEVTTIRSRLAGLMWTMGTPAPDGLAPAALVRSTHVPGRAVL